ncbi:MAG: N-acetyltransferase [Bacteroidetes bacterium]|nr:N-acetyltransferase [Bacteroidota bacterium]
MRLINESDAQSVLDIYTPYVLNTIISFEYEVPALDEFIQRITTVTADYPWLVCLYGSKIIGYTYAGKYKSRTAYQWSPESTIYMSPEFHHRGIARILYETLFSLLRLQGYYNVYACIGLPNEESTGFHKAMGFQEIGIFRNVGYKLGNWHDTHWFQLKLAGHILNPLTPKKLYEVASASAFQSVLDAANERLKILNTDKRNINP